MVRQIRDLIYDRVVNSCGGSFSAEHGVGPYNLDGYRRYTPPAQRTLAARVKQTFDPKGLLGHVDFS
jgi:FAD/FMN-containing dehydrogenase